MKELLPKKARPQKQPWRDSNNHGTNCESDIKRLPTKQLTNAEVYRVNLLPRSYDERVKQELHPRGFKMTGKTCKEFPEPSADLQTKAGKEMLARCEATFNAHVTKRKEEYDHFMANKRTIYASKMQPRWAPTSNMGEQFEEFKSDPNNLFMKTLEPLDRMPLQEEAFKRSTIAGIQFKNETGSII